MSYLELIPCMKSSDPNAVASWTEICLARHAKERKWIDSLRAAGIKAAHPDDGWVDRKKNCVNFCYPQFNDGAEFGDKIALGREDKYRIVKVIFVSANRFDPNFKTYYFDKVVP